MSISLTEKTPCIKGKKFLILILLLAVAIGIVLAVVTVKTVNKANAIAGLEQEAEQEGQNATLEGKPKVDNRNVTNDEVLIILGGKINQEANNSKDDGLVKVSEEITVDQEGEEEDKPTAHQLTKDEQKEITSTVRSAPEAEGNPETEKPRLNEIKQTTSEVISPPEAGSAPIEQITQSVDIKGTTSSHSNPPEVEESPIGFNQQELEEKGNKREEISQTGRGEGQEESEFIPRQSDPMNDIIQIENGGEFVSEIDPVDIGGEEIDSSLQLSPDGEGESQLEYGSDTEDEMSGYDQRRAIRQWRYGASREWDRRLGYGQREDLRQWGYGGSREGEWQYDYGRKRELSERRQRMRTSEYGQRMGRMGYYHRRETRPWGYGESRGGKRRWGYGHSRGLNQRGEEMRPWVYGQRGEMRQWGFGASREADQYGYGYGYGHSRRVGQREEEKRPWENGQRSEIRSRGYYNSREIRHMGYHYNRRLWPTGELMRPLTRGKGREMRQWVYGASREQDREWGYGHSRGLSQRGEGVRQSEYTPRRRGMRNPVNVIVIPTGEVMRPQKYGRSQEMSQGGEGINLWGYGASKDLAAEENGHSEYDRQGESLESYGYDPNNRQRLWENQQGDSGYNQRKDTGSTWEDYDDF